MTAPPTAYCFSTLLLLILLSLTANAQEAPQSRWTVGAAIGRGILLDCEICDPSNVINKPLIKTDPESYQVFSTEVSYRTDRWFGVVAGFDYGNLQAQSARTLIDNTGEDGFPVQQNVAVHSRILTLGPLFMLRLNQGDLGLEFRTGINVHHARVRATGFAGEQLDIKYKRRVNRCSVTRLSYTYWPSQWFGVQLAAELFAGNLTLSNFYEPRTPHATAYPDLPEVLLQRLTPEADGVNSFNLSLGVTYRLPGK